MGLFRSDPPLASPRSTPAPRRPLSHRAAATAEEIETLEHRLETAVAEQQRLNNELEVAILRCKDLVKRNHELEDRNTFLESRNTEILTRLSDASSIFIQLLNLRDSLPQYERKNVEEAKDDVAKRLSNIEQAITGGDPGSARDGEHSPVEGDLGTIPR